MLSLQSMEDVEEERRLFYVAITRAEKDYLFLLHLIDLNGVNLLTANLADLFMKLMKNIQKKEAKNKELFQKNIYLKTKNSDNKQINNKNLKDFQDF